MGLPPMTTLLVASALSMYAAQAGDETEIRAVVTRQGEAWTGHDAKAYAALFTDDCDVVNIVGWWWKGRAELAHARWTMTGARTPPGMPEPRTGIQTLVLTKAAGHWLIRGFQNTLSVPERPFPTAPPTPNEPTPRN